MMNRFFRPVQIFILIAGLLSSCALQATDKPHIGLIYNTQQYEHFKAGNDDQKSYREAIEANGGQVWVLAADEDSRLTEKKVRFLDGLLLPGGDDVNPGRYGEKPHQKLEKVDDPLDAFEFALIDSARQKALPIMGICRGEQILNVAMGGSLYQDIPTQFKSSHPVSHRKKVNGKAVLCLHQCRIQRESRYAGQFPNDCLVVNSFHHQAVKALGDNLLVTGLAEDGTVEMIENASGSFVLGVQFHPEKMRGENARFDQLFQEFLMVAQAYSRQHPGH